MKNLSTYDKATLALNHVTDEDELIRLNRYINARIKELLSAKSAAVKMTLNPGDTVQWTGKKGTQHGTVVAIKRKYAHVDVGTGTWRVPLGMLQIAA